MHLYILHTYCKIMCNYNSIKYTSNDIDSHIEGNPSLCHVFQFNSFSHDHILDGDSELILRLSIHGGVSGHFTVGADVHCVVTVAAVSVTCGGEMENV